jgi:hypothetical protein
MAALSEWLQIMLGEIARKRDDLERAREEDVKRRTEKSSDTAAPTGSTAAALRTNAAPPT